MENKRIFFCPQGVLVILLCLIGALGSGLMLFLKTTASLPQHDNNIINHGANNTPPRIFSKFTNGKSLSRFKTTMLTTWHKEAQSKGMIPDVPSQFQGKVLKSATLPPNKKVIALTFDDGPWPKSTDQILDILNKNDVKGTFFVLGKNVQLYPDLTRRIVNDGHSIANHTWHHWYHAMNPQVAAYEVASTTDIIFKTTGVKTGLFRPPGGAMTNGVASYAKNNQYAVIMWSSDSIDYSRPNPNKIIANVFRTAQPGGIVLMHDGGGDRSHTVKALPQIINKFRKQGYSFVTVPQLLEMQEKPKQVVAKKK